jgi:sugar phosphate isomerase/epimerase
LKKLSISCGGISGLVNRYGIKHGFEICKKSGFDAVDFDLETYKLNDDVYGGSEDAFVSHFSEIKRIADSLELEIGQTHGRCESYDPVDTGRADWFHKITEKDLKATAILGAPACVVHFINSSRFGKQPAEKMRQISNDMYNAIIPYAEESKVKIALETFGAARISGDRIRDFFADPDEYLWQYNNMKTRYKTMCVDTGHTHEAGSFWVPPVEDMIRKLGSDITLLHLHDNTGHWDDHLLPGMGSINWPSVFDALDEIGYNGNYNCELRLGFCGYMLEDYVAFAGKYMRKFVDSRGKL